MKIYLVRHGIASDRIGGPILNDGMRPLTDEGRAETKAVAKGLKRLGVKPDVMVVSPLVRTRQTAEILAECLSLNVPLDLCPDLAPGGSPSSIFKFLQQFDTAKEIMLVGHEPDVGTITAALIGADDLELPFQKAGVCRVDIASLPPNSSGVLKWFITPKIASLLESN
ncbi:unnamed protein product [Sphagnum balticum]